MASGPTTLEADTILSKKGVAIVPDVLANAGGVLVSYFEWEQNKKKEHWTEAAVFTKLRMRMEQAADNVIETAKKRKVSLREAAYVIAIERIASAPLPKQ